MPTLCDLHDVKDWLTIPADQTTDDALLERLISATSDDFLNCINRADFFPAQNYLEYRQGNGLQEMFLLHYPLNYVTSLVIDTFTVPPSPDGIADGWWFDPQNDSENAIKLTLIGFQYTNWRNWLQRAFPNWASTRNDILRNNIAIYYNAGYAVDDITDELWTIPAVFGGSPSGYVNAYQVRVLQARHFDTDKGVNHSGGGALTKVSSNPTVGQYAVDAEGNYTFSAADANTAVKISYSVVGIPQSIEQAVIDWVSFRYKMKGSIGQSSRRTAAGDSTTFKDYYMPPSTAAVCQRYSRMQF